MRKRKTKVWEWSRSLILLRTLLWMHGAKGREGKKPARKALPSDAGQPGEQTTTQHSLPGADLHLYWVLGEYG